MPVTQITHFLKPAIVQNILTTPAKHPYHLHKKLFQSSTAVSFLQCWTCHMEPPFLLKVSLQQAPTPLSVISDKRLIIVYGLSQKQKSLAQISFFFLNLRGQGGGSSLMFISLYSTFLVCKFVFDDHQCNCFLIGCFLSVSCLLWAYLRRGTIQVFTVIIVINFVVRVIMKILNTEI